MQAQDVMSRDVVTVTPDATILHAARLMLQRKFSGFRSWMRRARWWAW